MNSDYINNNKEAWEDSFARSTIGFGENDGDRLRTETFPFLEKDLIAEIKKHDLKGKKVLQLCCNNGREIMSIAKGTGAVSSIGIDIAENIIAQAKKNATEAQINCAFYAGNVLEPREDLLQEFDAVFVLIGALCWFEDLTAFFSIASQYLKKDGKLFVYEIHPCSNMIPIKGDAPYDEDNPLKFGWSYFKKEPFEDTDGMGYMDGGIGQSKVFTSFSYTFSDIINGISESGLRITKCLEFDYDVGGNFPHLDGQGFPFTLMIVAEKN